MYTLNDRFIFSLPFRGKSAIIKSAECPYRCVMVGFLYRPFRG